MSFSGWSRDLPGPLLQSCSVADRSAAGPGPPARLLSSSAEAARPGGTARGSATHVRGAPAADDRDRRAVRVVPILFTRRPYRTVRTAAPGVCQSSRAIAGVEWICTRLPPLRSSASYPCRQCRPDSTSIRPSASSRATSPWPTTVRRSRRLRRRPGGSRNGRGRVPIAGGELGVRATARQASASELTSSAPPLDDVGASTTRAGGPSLSRPCVALRDTGKIMSAHPDRTPGQRIASRNRSPS